MKRLMESFLIDGIPPGIAISSYLILHCIIFKGGLYSFETNYCSLLQAPQGPQLQQQTLVIVTQWVTKATGEIWTLTFFFQERKCNRKGKDLLVFDKLLQNQHNHFCAVWSVYCVEQLEMQSSSCTHLF